MTINFNKYPDGLIPAIVQDASTKRILMFYMNMRHKYNTGKTTSHLL